MEQRAGFSAHGPDAFQILDHSHLVVGVHQTHDGLSPLRQQRREVFEIHFAIRQVAYQVQRSARAPLEGLSGFDDGTVFGFRCDDASAPEVPNRAAQHQVVRFRSSRCEIDAAGVAIEVLGHPTAALFNQHP